MHARQKHTSSGQQLSTWECRSSDPTALPRGAVHFKHMYHLNTNWTIWDCVTSFFHLGGRLMEHMK